MLNVLEVLNKLQMDLNLRGEKLSVHDLNKLAHALEEFN